MKKVKRLARLTLAAGGEVDEQLASFILGRLTRTELKEYLFELRRALGRRRVLVSVSGETAPALLEELEREFSGRQTVVSRDESLGGGVRLRAGDDVIDASVKGLFSETMDRLRKG
jgi:hypothetical protein